MSIKKQEAAVGENDAEETLDECIARVKAENPEISDEDARAKCTSQPPAEGEAEKGLRDQILSVMKEYGDTIATQVKKEIETKMQEVVKQTRDEMVKSIRKGLGLEKDPVVHLSDVEKVVREIVLDKSPHGKRTETATPEKPSEGTADLAKSIVKPADDIFKDLQKNRGTF